MSMSSFDADHKWEGETAPHVGHIGGSGQDVRRELEAEAAPSRPIRRLDSVNEVMFQQLNLFRVLSSMVIRHFGLQKDVDAIGEILAAFWWGEAKLNDMPLSQAFRYACCNDVDPKTSGHANLDPAKGKHIRPEILQELMQCEADDLEAQTGVIVSHLKKGLTLEVFFEEQLPAITAALLKGGIELPVESETEKVHDAAAVVVFKAAVPPTNTSHPADVRPAA